MKRRPNPYVDLSRGALHDAASRRAGELMTPTGTRSRDERAALALDTAHLLLVLAGHVSIGEYCPGSPQHKLDGGKIGLRDVFAAEYAKMTREARYVIFMQAADAALGGGVPSWISRDVVGSELYEAAMQSDDGLLTALEKMQAVHQTKRPRKR